MALVGLKETGETTEDGSGIGIGGSTSNAICGFWRTVIPASVLFMSPQIAAWTYSISSNIINTSCLEIILSCPQMKMFPFPSVMILLKFKQSTQKES